MDGMDSFLRRTVKVTAREVRNMEIIMLLVSFDQTPRVFFTGSIRDDPY